MSATTRRLIVLFVVLALFTWVFSDAIFCDRNFIYRDAGHFYYPLMKLVADEWNAGRWPLWNPYENAGMPLLGSPTSAVMYPPRIVMFQWLPISYAAAFKWYTLLHVLFAAGTAYTMARNWRASEFAAGLAALTYAFGAVVMFQYCNVTFLVGAAWVPLGLVATDRMFVVGDWRWAVALGAVITMQMLGGDPEAAYVTGVLAALYLVMLDAPLATGLVALIDVHALVNLGVVGAARRRLAWRPDLEPERFADVVAFIACSALVTAGVLWFLFRVRRSKVTPLDTRLVWRRRFCLGLAAVVAAGLSAVQWIPSWEFGRLSIRSAGDLHVEPYAFWLAPWRLAEFFWPNVSGHQFPFTTRWLDIIQVNDRVWEASLYGGVLPVVLALGAWRMRGAPHWHRWLSVILVLSLWASTGPAGGPSWYFNLSKLAAANQPGANAANAGHLRNELENPAGGLYWFLVQALPGFGTFRYPAKLMTFAVAALAVLAAVGWDRLFSDDGRRWNFWLFVLALASGVLGLAMLLANGAITGWFGRAPIAHHMGPYGPLQFGNSLWQTMRQSFKFFVHSHGSVLVADAFWCIVAAFLQTVVLLVAVAAILRRSRTRTPASSAAAVVLAIVALDLGLANRWLVATAPQSQIDATSAVAQIIADAETAEAHQPDAQASGQNAAAETDDPAEPFRVHRMSIWGPPGFSTTLSTRRHEEVHRWEKDTIQPKYGLLAPAGGDTGDRIQYTVNEGTSELFDYWFFFSPFTRETPPRFFAQAADPNAVPPRVVYYPRRGFDMWNVKYFVLPNVIAIDDQNRGILSFLPNAREIAASPPTRDDVRVLRNLSCHPRAWIVHQLEFREPIHDMTRESRQPLMEQILYQGDELWFSPDRERTKRDPREMAWVEVEPADLARVAEYHRPHADASADTCRILHYSPDRVELKATTAARGLVILADALYPGWHATIDGSPAPILRANRMMRGLTLEPGTHRIVVTYDPLSFRIGAGLSLSSIAALCFTGLVVAAIQFRRGPASG